ncbi:MAG: bifunctional adenosylcobinamide kinase/adenosylcobinamide-phosphate guanylyltransferase [Pseudanabaenaceae cyanobacterium]
MFILVTGPTRSGKSEWAEEITYRLFSELLNRRNDERNDDLNHQLAVDQKVVNPILDSLQLDHNQPSVELIYIATASHNPDDPEWTARITEHQQRRCAPWQTREVPQALSQTLNGLNSNQVVLVDALGTWLANFLELDDQAWQTIETELITAVGNCQATLICVAEEVGWSVVPAYALGRTFRDRLGRLVRQLAGIADQTYLVVAGFALDLRQLGTRVSS